VAAGARRRHAPPRLICRSTRRRSGAGARVVRIRLKTAAGVPMHRGSARPPDAVPPGGDDVAPASTSDPRQRAGRDGDAAGAARPVVRVVDPARPAGRLRRGAGAASVPSRSFSGYRLLHEYSRSRSGSGSSPSGCAPPGPPSRRGDRARHPARARDPGLARSRDPGSFALNCTPAINLFPGAPTGSTSPTSMPSTMRSGSHAPDLSPHRERVVGCGDGAQAEQEFRPFYSAVDATASAGGYSRCGGSPARVRGAVARRGADRLHRPRCSARRPAKRRTRRGIRQLALEILATNRDLALLMPVVATPT
jgi:hypothetical protein